MALFHLVLFSSHFKRTIIHSFTISLFSRGLRSLSWIFPNLRVIGGQSLIQHYALVIYSNDHLEDVRFSWNFRQIIFVFFQISLPNLRVIRNGGVRIAENKMLCRARSIDWKHIVAGPVNDIFVDNAAETSMTETGRGRNRNDRLLIK